MVGYMDDNETWAAVDAYIEQALVAGDDALTAALDSSTAAGLPAISVSPTQGKLLHLLARAVGARRILEIGTLGGYSTIWLARAVPAEGQVVTLELSEHHAQVARANLELAGVQPRVEVVVGPALESMQRLAGPFDLVFIDADKAGIPDYVDRALDLTRPGALIVVDNVVRQGRLLDADGDANVQGVRRLHDMLRSEPRLDATTIQTVGTKGYDGFTLALVV